jgi:hypothetical protein
METLQRNVGVRGWKILKLILTLPDLECIIVPVISLKKNKMDRERTKKRKSSRGKV